MGKYPRLLSIVTTEHRIGTKQKGPSLRNLYACAITRAHYAGSGQCIKMGGGGRWCIAA